MLDMGALRELAPNALPDYLEALISEPAALQRAGLTTPLRLSHFLAQTAHETAGYVIARENTRWTPEQMCALWPGRFKTRLDPRILACRGDEQRLANLAYGGRLGNVDADDGWAYRGGGFLQLTGRAAYHDAGSALGVDLEGMPELIEDAAISLNAALYYWTKHDINRFADRNYACMAMSARPNASMTTTTHKGNVTVTMVGNLQPQHLAIPHTAKVPHPRPTP